MPNSKMLSRRGILLTGAIATAGALLARGASAATGQTQLSPDDPQAMALGYYEDASEVDTAAWPKKAGTDQNCANCALYQPSDDVWGGCGIFPGKLVKAEGWCNVWAPRA